MDWEQRYAGTTQLFGDAPSELLLSEQHRLQPGLRLLAVGDGEGRNGVWLATQGLEVTAIDISATALQRSQTRAKLNHTRLETICANIMQWAWPADTFDVITSIFVHSPPAQRQFLHQSIYHAVKPGGLILIEAFHADQLRLNSGGPRDPSLLLTEDMLIKDFEDAEILRLEQVTTKVAINGQLHGDGSALHFVARRPA